MTPISALKAAIRTALLGHAPLLAALGGPKVFDDVPRTASAPYLAFGDVTARENGTATDRGHVSDVTLLVWSRQGGSMQALGIADHVSECLDDQLLPMIDHRMVHARITATEARRFPDKDLTRVALRLRIVTEVI